MRPRSPTASGPSRWQSLRSTTRQSTTCSRCHPDCRRRRAAVRRAVRSRASAPRRLLRAHWTWRGSRPGSCRREWTGVVSRAVACVVICVCLVITPSLGCMQSVVHFFGGSSAGALKHSCHIDLCVQGPRPAVAPGLQPQRGPGGAGGGLARAAHRLDGAQRRQQPQPRAGESLRGRMHARMHAPPRMRGGAAHAFCIASHILHSQPSVAQCVKFTPKQLFPLTPPGQCQGQVAV